MRAFCCRCCPCWHKGCSAFDHLAHWQRVCAATHHHVSVRSKPTHSSDRRLSDCTFSLCHRQQQRQLNPSTMRATETSQGWDRRGWDTVGQIGESEVPNSISPQGQHPMQALGSRLGPGISEPAISRKSNHRRCQAAHEPIEPCTDSQACAGVNHTHEYTHRDLHPLTPLPPFPDASQAYMARPRASPSMKHRRRAEGDPRERNPHRPWDRGRDRSPGRRLQSPEPASKPDYSGFNRDREQGDWDKRPPLERVTNTGTPRSRMLQGLPIRHRVLPNQKTVIHQDRNNSIVRSINRAITHEIVKQSEGVPEVHRLQIASEAASNTINSATTVIAPVLKIASETKFHLLEKPIIIFLARDRLRE